MDYLIRLKMSNFFSIVIDTCNHEQWIEKCIQSCLSQKYSDFEIVIVDAISTDRTWEICQEYAKDFPDKIRVYQNEVRIPQIANMLFLTEMSKPGSVVVSVDGDDWLKSTQVLNKLNEVYSNNDVWMSYGTYEEFPYRDVRFHYHAYPDEVIESNSFREHAWLASHLRTYKRELFLRIDINDFKLPNGQWLDTTGDQAFMLPMLEMASDRSRYVSDILYVYNVANQSRDTQLNESRQVELSKYIRSKTKYSRLEKI